MRNLACLLTCFCLGAVGSRGLAAGLGLPDTIVIDAASSPAAFPLVAPGQLAPLWLDTADHAGVLRAAADLQADIERVTGQRPVLAQTSASPGSHPVVIGTLGQSTLIDSLVQAGKLDAGDLAGKWESFVITTVAHPWPGVAQALVIAGSDKRGTIYGLYELSEQLGVSPWYWWTDVPVRRRSAAYVVPGRFASGEPVVRYRGIFLNDEAPALTGWVHARHGGYRRQFYTKVFELLLRLRGNYLWPAMWGNAFNEDDPLNPALADEYGIVMGTSHHEPMLRAQQEWSRHKGQFGNGEWNYLTNEAGLQAFWRAGIARNQAYESIVTIGMRGDGDEPMSEEADVALLERIVADQRRLLTEETGRPAAAIPQLWALYKEVQEYYERGLRVPDDVTLLWCDDNWGNLRRLPTPEERDRPGGAGVYYHFDYVGGPRSYKWVNTVPLPKVQEQMHLAWQHGANRIWIVNVGDLKPMEVPLEFFLRMAWDPARWTADRMDDYLATWATREFGAVHAAEAADLVAAYTKFNGRRKPEMLSPDTFSLLHHREAERVVQEWRALAARAAQLHAALPAEARDAFYQLVLHPIQACAIVHDLYVTTALNRRAADQQRASTNALGDQARALFQADADLTAHWNNSFAGGKWVHLMDQPRIGYTSWNQPAQNILPALRTYAPPALAELGVALEGATAALPPGATGLLPPLHSEGGPASRAIEIFRRGTGAADFTIAADQPWVQIVPAGGRVGDDVRAEVSLDWSRVPTGRGEVVLTVRGTDGAAARLVRLPFAKAAPPPADAPEGFLDLEGYVAIEAPHFDRAVDGAGATWQVLPDFGRTLGGVTTAPVTAASRLPDAASPRLEYAVHLARGGEVAVRLVTAPTLDYVPGRGLRCALSFDDQPPRVVDLLADRSVKGWETAVGEGVRTTVAYLEAPAPGWRVLKFWRVDPGVVLQRIELDAGGLRPTYLGPPESPRGRRAAVVEPAAPTPVVTVQAEAGQLGADFAVTTSAPAFIGVTGSTSGSAPGSAARVARYAVTFPAAGSYRLFARVRVGAGTFNDDSLFIGAGFGPKNPTTGSQWVTVNGLAALGFTQSADLVAPAASAGTAGAGAWKWIDLTRLTGLAPFVVPAGALTQVLDLGGREDGLDLDKLVFGPEGHVFTVADLNAGTSSAPAQPRPFTLQAEAAQLGSAFTTAAGPPAAITVAPGSTGSAPASATRVARFTASFPAAGVYRVFARVRVGSGGFDDDSLFVARTLGAKDPAAAGDWVAVNGFAHQGFAAATDVVSPAVSGTAGTGVWKWIDLTKLGGLTPFAVAADALTQVFDVAGREDGLDLDLLVFAPATHTYAVADLETGGLGTAPPSQPVVTVALDEARQMIDGFGASSAWTAASLSDAQADQFFSPQTGLGLSLLRLRIAPSGETGELATARKAVARGVQVWATPWTPPAEWKSNGDVNHGGTLLPEYHDDWAARLADFVARTQTAGVPLLALSAQNEPNWTADWESCRWTPAELTAFVRDHLGPALAVRGLPTRALAPETINWDTFAAFSNALLADPAARAHLSHVATHSYGGAAFAYAAPAAHGLPFWQTEYSDAGADSDPGMDSALRVGNSIHDFLTIAQGNAWHYWWLLPRGDSPASTGALVENGVMARRAWALGNWARFVRPGHRRVQAYGSQETFRATAFVSPDRRRFALVVVNSDYAPCSFPLALEGGALASLTPWETSVARSLAALAPVAAGADGCFSLSVPARSVTTFVSEALNAPPTALALEGAALRENLPAGTLAGNLSASDADPGETFTYALVEGPASDDNAGFTLVASGLRSAVAFDHEERGSRTVRIRVTDSLGASHEQAFTITIGNDAAEYADWSASLPLSDRATSADPDGDGLPNLLAYAFGSAAGESVRDEWQPTLGPAGSDSVQFTFLLPAAAPTDVRYAIERSFDLRSWIVLAERNTLGLWQGAAPVEVTPLAGGRIRVSLLHPRGERVLFCRLRTTLVAGMMP